MRNPIIMIRSVVNLSLLLSTLVFISSCDTGDERNPGQWQLFGLENKRVFELTLSGNHLYAAAGKDGLYRKDVRDERNRWELLGLSELDVQFGVQSFYRNPESGTMYAGFYEPNFAGHGVFRSTDNGQTWEPFDEGIVLNPGDDRTAVVLKLGASPSAPGRLFAGTIGGVFIKESGGDVWERAVNAPVDNVYSMAFNAQNEAEIWIGGDDDRGTARLAVTEDGGTNWESVIGIQSIAQFTDRINEINVHPANSGIVYVGLHAAIAKTEDGGENWARLQPSTISEDNFRFIQAIRINPVNPREIVGAGKFLYRSTDAGRNWTFIADTTRSIITDIQVDWKKRIIYGSLSNPERGVFSTEF